jgi:hypothetical protein
LFRNLELWAPEPSAKSHLHPENRERSPESLFRHRASAAEASPKPAVEAGFTQEGKIMTTNTANGVSAIDKLVIESEIARLMATYVHYLDDGKFNDIAKMMAHAEFGMTGYTATGVEGVEGFLIAAVQRHEDGTPRTWHAVSNVLFDVQSRERATAVSYYTVHQELEGFPLQPISTGRYHDIFEKIEGEWRFVSRLLEPRLAGILINHSVAALEASKA